jgi:hypothetical protein
MYNPLAVVVFLEALRIHPYDYSDKFAAVWSHWEFGAQAILCPVYSNLGVLFEWMPALFAVFRVRYDVYLYHGFFGEVPTDDTVPSHVVESALNSPTEVAFGQRVMLQPTLRGQMGPVIVQSQTDAAWYQTGTDFPYIFNWDYETYIEPKDFIIENRTDLLLELQRGAGETRFLVGPQYTFTYAVHTKLRRQRAGISVLWVPRDRPDKKGYLWLALASGVNLEAVLDEGSPYLIFGVGGSWQDMGNRK